MYPFGLRPLHLCGTRLEGGHRRLSRTLRFAWPSQRAAASSARRHAGTHVSTPASRHASARARAGAGARKVFGNRFTSSSFRIALVFDSGRGRQRHHANGSPSTPPYRRERPWCPPSRRVPHKWSGRRPNRYTGRVSGLSLSNAEDLSEQRGWTPRSPRETPKCRERWRKPSPRSRRRAMREVRSAKCEVRGTRCQSVPGLKAEWPGPRNPRRTFLKRRTRRRSAGWRR